LAIAKTFYVCKMNANIEILQQRAKVDLLKQLKACGRATADQVLNAERRLVELLDITVEMPVIVKPIVLVAKDIDVPTSIQNINVTSIRSDIMSEIDKLSRRRAELCNSMHDVPQHTPCPEIMMEIIEIAAKVENAWTRYRYLERNGKLLDETEQVTKAKSIDLMVAVDQRQKLAQKISKLKVKIESVLNQKNRNLDSWKVTYEYSVLERNRLDDEIYILKNG
jgi:hypothetical protein